MLKPDLMLMEQDELSLEEIDVIVSHLRQLERSPGWKIMERDLRERMLGQQALLAVVDPDKPGAIGRHQGGSNAFQEAKNWVTDHINFLNDARDQMLQERAEKQAELVKDRRKQS